MKISKKSVLIMGGILCTASFGLLYVSADRELFMNPRNAIQYMENVKFIDETSDTTATLKKSIYNDFLRIETNNLILGQNGDKKNSIIANYNSIILGGEKNNIVGSADVIIGGSENIVKGTYNSIIGGEGNSIEHYQSFNTIIGGKNNHIFGSNTDSETGNPNLSVIAGGSNNSINLSKYSVIMGNNSSITEGNNSVALGSSSNIEANNSFLWTDGSSSDTLTNDNVFAIMASNGAIIDTDEAHSSAKLTLGKSLILSKNENQSSITCGGGKGGGIIKIEKSEDANQMCLCSCDGHGWNSVSKGSCINVCNNGTSTEIESAKCDNKVSRICPEGIITYSGSCKVGNVIEGTGAYFVDKNGTIHRSCQTDDGTVANCTGSIDQPGCNTQVTSTFSCTNPPANAVLITGSDQNLTANTPGKVYSGVEAAGTNKCAYICDNTHIYTGYNGGTCITKSSTYSCTGSISIYAILITGSDQNLTGNIERKIYQSVEAAGTNKCAYVCDNNHEYKNGDCKNKPGIHSCKKGILPDHATLWHPEITPSNSSARFTYSEIDTQTPCAYHCDDGYSYNRINECLENKCQSTYLSLPDNAELWYPDIKPNNHTTNYFYLAAKPEGAKACAFHCKENYIYDRVKNECIAKTQQANCTGLPSNAEWINGKFTQTWDGSAWTPENGIPTYNSSSSTECSFKCKTNYEWNGNSCIEKNEQPACNPTYNGKTFTGETTTLKESYNLCSKGDVKVFTFNKNTHQRTRQCKNGSNKIDCSAQAAPVAYLRKGKEIKGYFRMIGDIKRSEKKEKNNYTISKDTSPYDVFLGYGGGLYSEAETIFMNKDSSHMFEDASHLTISNRLQKFNTDHVEDISYMFCKGGDSYGIINISSDAFDNFNTKNVTNMSYMFCGISNTELVPNFNTESVTNMSHMFHDNDNLITLDLSNFDTRSVKDMSYMFYDNDNLATLDLSGPKFDTSGVKDMSYMFYDNDNLITLDLSKFNTKSVTNMLGMFTHMVGLTTIYTSDTFSTNSVPDGQNVFAYNGKLKGIAGTSSSGTKKYGKEYAKIDGGPSSPGFFRAK